jgi:hypothetical protein
MRHIVYDSIQSVLADGEWHDAQELEGVTQFPLEWVGELQREGELAVSEQGEHVYVRSLKQHAIVA